MALCLECLPEMKELMAALMELSDRGKKGVPLDELGATLEERSSQKSHEHEN